MEKKRKIGLIVVIILIVLFMFLGIFFANGYLRGEDYAEKQLKYHLKDDKLKLDLCKKNNCIHAGNKLPYTILTLDYKNDLLQSEVEKINKETEKLYKEDDSSSTSSSLCSKVKDIYKKRYVHSNAFDVFENNDYISIVIQRTKTDFCTDEYNTSQADIIIYDKKTEKLINQEEFIKKVGVSNSDIIDAINKSMDNYNKNYTHYDEEFSDYKLFYTTTGDLVVSYKLPDVDSYEVTSVVNAN